MKFLLALLSLGALILSAPHTLAQPTELRVISISTSNSPQSGENFDVLVHATDAGGLQSTVGSQTVIGLDFGAANLSLFSGSTQATMNIGSSEATISLALRNGGNSAIPTTVSVSVVSGTPLSATSTNITIGANRAPVVTVTFTSLTTNEDLTTNFSVSLIDPDDATADIVLSASSENPVLVPTANIVQVGVTSANTQFSLTPGTNQNVNSEGVPTIQISASDGVNSRSTSFNLTVNAVNDVPVFEHGPDLGFYEDNGPVSTAWILPDFNDGDPEVSQALTFHVTSNNAALFDIQPSINNINGVITFGALPSSNGTATIFVSLSDNGGTAHGGVNSTATKTAKIIIVALNDAPSFTTGASVSVAEDSGLYSAAFAGAIDDGDPELNQALTFHLVSDNAALFAVQPAITATNGNLSFVPAANAHGTALVSVSLSDSGAFSAGNVNTSATQQFSIEVISVNDPPQISTSQTLLSTDVALAITTSVLLADVDTPITGLSLSVHSDNPALLPTNNIVQLGATAATSYFRFSPLSATLGSVNVTITVDDGEFQRSTTFTLDVLNNVPIITFVSPPANTTASARDADIVINFLGEMDTGTLTTATMPTNANLILYGMQSGHISTAATLTYTNGNTRVVIDPAARFHAGEQVMLTVTGASNIGGVSMSRALVHSFRAAADHGRAVFGQTLLGAGQSGGLAIGDLDGDGDLDAIIANHVNAGQEIWLNNGDATFAVSSFGGGNSTDVALGDLDGDGDLDAIVCNTGQPNQIWLNNGDAKFSTQNIGGSLDSYKVSIGDLDGDGDLDAVVANRNSQAQELLYNRGDGMFTVSTKDAGFVKSLEIGDLDGDGDLDIFLVNFSGFPNRVWINNGAGSFTNVLHDIDGGQDVALGDLDGDGDLDALLVSDPHVLLRNYGNATFSSSYLPPTPGLCGSCTAIALGDVDGDGDLDAIVTNADDGKQQGLWINDGNAGFSFQAIGADRGIGVDFGDLDNDGDLDAIVAGFVSSGQQILRNLPPLPEISAMTPVVTTANLNTLELMISGAEFEFTQAQISVLNPDGSPAGTTTLTISNATRGALTAHVAAGLLSTAGTLTVTISNPAGTTSTTLTVLNDIPTISTSQTAVVGQEDVALLISMTVNDVSPGFPGLVILTPAADLTTVASITQIGATAATTQFLVTPVTNASGSLPLRFQVSDGSLSSSTTFNVNFLPVNDPPTISIGQTQMNLNENENGALTLQISDVDTPFDLLQLSATSANQTLLPDSGLVLGATSATTLLQIQPMCFEHGTSAVVVNISDGDNIRTTSFIVNVSPLASLSISGSTCGCPDVLLTYTALPPSSSATHHWTVVGGHIASGQGSGSIQLVWDRGATIASVSVERTVSSLCTTASVLNVTPRNIQAVMDYLAVSTASASSNVVNNDIGLDLTVAAVDDPAGGMASASGGSITYTPDPGFSGLDMFNYVVSSPGGCLATGSVVAAVAAGEDANVNIELVERQKDRSAGVRGLRRAVAAALSPDGQFVYAAGRSDHSIAVFSRDTADGSLTFNTRVRDGRNAVSGLKYVDAVALSPDGQFLCATGYGDNSLVLFERDADTGLLTFVERKKQGQMDDGKVINGMKRPRGLAVSADGNSIYVSGYGNNGLAVFRLNKTIGNLSFVEFFKDGHDGVDGLNKPVGINVSLDGKHVYVAGSGESAVSLFNRNVVTGELTFLARHKDGGGGIDGLNSAVDVAVSPDGRHVYVAGAGDDAIALFRRNAGSGRLSFVEIVKNGSNGVSGLDGVSSVAVSPDGGQVWATGQNSNAVVIFKRRSHDGRLTFMQSVSDGNDGFDGLAGAMMNAVNNDGRHSYVPGSLDDALSVLFRNRIPAALDDAAGTTAKNSTLVIEPLVNDDDADAHTLTISAKTDGALGTVAITGGGTTLDYSAGATTGVDQFTYTIEDGHGGSSTATVTVSIVNAKSGHADLTVEYSNAALLTVSPNPARDNIQVAFTLDEAARVQVRLTDVQGQRLTGFELKHLPAGKHVKGLDLFADSGAKLSAGMYYVELKTVNSRGVERTSTCPLLVR